MQTVEKGRGRKSSNAKGPSGSGLKPGPSSRTWPAPGAAGFGRHASEHRWVPAQHCAGRGERRRRRREPGKGEGAWPPLGLGDPRDPSDRLTQSGDSSAGPPSTRPAAGNAPRACAHLASTGINSRDVCACLFLSLEVAHFHFLLPFRSSASSVSACACVGGARARLSARSRWTLTPPAGRALRDRRVPAAWRQARRGPAA